MTLLALGRDDFTRLLGPLQKLLERQAATYDTPTAKITKVGVAGVLLLGCELACCCSKAGDLH